MGSMPLPYSPLAKEFDGLALCAMEYQHGDLFPGVDVVRAALNDDGSPMTRDEAFSAVSAAGRVISWLRGGNRVLVTCMQGRNRSGLVCALALCKGAGLSLDKAVEAIRAARGDGALRNPYFLRFLQDYCGRSR